MFRPSNNPCQGFDLTPITFGATRQEVCKAFSRLREGRIAFESEGIGNELSYNVASLGYILSETPVDFLNAGYAEIGEASIYEKYVRFFNSNSNQNDFEIACQGCGVKYMVAFTEDFRRLLEKRGYRLISSVKDILLTHTPNGAPATITIFELPWESNLISPQATMQIEKNQIKIFPHDNQEYLIKLTAFKGWRAFQNNRRIPIVDGNPGMIIRAHSNDEITLKYKYRYYWL